jgi:hypothetical protein
MPSPNAKAMTPNSSIGEVVPGKGNQIPIRRKRTSRPITPAPTPLRMDRSMRDSGATNGIIKPAKGTAAAARYRMRESRPEAIASPIHQKKPRENAPDLSISEITVPSPQDWSKVYEIWSATNGRRAMFLALLTATVNCL